MNEIEDLEAPAKAKRAAVWSEAAEQAVLGSLLLDCGTLSHIRLTEADFHSAAHRVIFGAIMAEVAQGRHTDELGVFLRLQGEGRELQAGGLAYINALGESVTSSRGIKRHAEIVKDKARHRALLAASDEAAEIALAGDEPIAEKTERIAALFQTLQREHVERMPRKIAEIALARTAYYEDLQEGRAVPGWPTGIPGLDSMLGGGLKPGGLYILAARPKVGKSSLAQTICVTLAKRQLPSLFLSQEMSSEEVADRAVVSAGRLNYTAMLTGKMGHDDWRRASDALEDLSSAAMWVDDQGGLTLYDIIAKARSIPGLRVLVLDYLQLSSSKLKDANRNAQIEELTRGLKAFAKQAGLAVLALSQLNRKVEERASKRPMLSDLRDSGAIEQDADAVMFLWPHRDLDGGAKLVGLAVEANRQGRCGSVGLHFDGSTQTWGESTMSVEHEPIKQQQRGRGFE